jgi:hypothetical protein
MLTHIYYNTIMQFFQTCLALGSVVAGCTRARVLACAVVTGRPVVARVAPTLFLSTNGPRRHLQFQTTKRHVTAIINIKM